MFTVEQFRAQYVRNAAELARDVETARRVTNAGAGGAQGVRYRGYYFHQWVGKFVATVTSTNATDAYMRLLKGLPAFDVQEYLQHCENGGLPPVLDGYQERAPVAAPQQLLVVVRGGVFEGGWTSVPGGVELTLVDFDNIESGDPPPELPAGCRMDDSGHITVPDHWEAF